MTTAPALPLDDRPTTGPRPALTPAELTGLAAIAIAVAGFGLSGLLRDVPGTAEYVGTVSVLVTGVALLRRRPLPAPLVVAAAVAVVVHLAGGLVRVGDGVLYNASPGTEVLRYDHLAHALGIVVGTSLLWELFVRGSRAAAAGGQLVVLALLAGLGLGAVNETVEFLATQAHGGGHVGGYTNTGWDLVVNSGAGMAGGLLLERRRRRDLRETGSPS